MSRLTRYVLNRHSVLASANCRNVRSLMSPAEKAPDSDAKQRGAQRREWILIFLHRVEGRNHRQPRGIGPGIVVRMQRFAIRVTDQRGAVVDLGRPSRGRLEILRLRQKREPAAELLAVVLAIEPQKIGRAVAGAVARVRQQLEIRVRPSDNPAPPPAARRAPEQRPREHARAIARRPRSNVFDHHPVRVVGKRNSRRLRDVGFDGEHGGVVTIRHDLRRLDRDSQRQRLFANGPAMHRQSSRQQPPRRQATTSNAARIRVVKVT